MRDEVTEVTEAMAREFARANPFFRKEAHLVDQHWPKYLPAIRAALAAAEAMGWRLVPVEATEEMRLAMSRACDRYTRSWQAIHAAAIAAAPRVGGDDATGKMGEV